MKLKKDTLNDVYREIEELIGFENMEKLFNYYKGQVVSFPTRMHSKEYVLHILNTEFDGKNAKELARKLGYSERWILKLIKENKN